MTVLAEDRTATARSTPRRFTTRGRTVNLTAAAAVLLLVAALSLFVGSRSLSVAEVWTALWAPDDAGIATVVRDLRLPRAAVAILVGAALGAAGALMQSLTRNPLADPGLLGINAGASLAVVLAVAVLGIASVELYLWFAFLGAGLAAVAVYLLGSVGRSAATPVRLALAGIALSAALTALVQTVILADQEAFNEFRFWVAGSLEGRGWPVAATIVAFVVIGAVVALTQAPALNALAFGDETGAALGVSPHRVRAVSFVAIVLLCGSATAAAGPILFVGLGVPYLARAVWGSDQRWVLSASLLLGPTVLLVADVLARVLVAPQEVAAGVVTARLGGPVFLAIVRRRRIEAL